MKKNINRLILQIDPKPTAKLGGKFKVSYKDAHSYTNKILVDAKEFNRPSHMEELISQEMEEYPLIKKNIEKINTSISQKIAKEQSLQKKLIQLELKFSFLLLQDVMGLLRLANRNELEKTRQKLMKLQMNLMFKLQSEEVEPHIEENLADFIKELSSIINKTTAI